MQLLNLALLRIGTLCAVLQWLILKLTQAALEQHVDASKTQGSASIVSEELKNVIKSWSRFSDASHFAIE